jgi:hypothetical protein
MHVWLTERPPGEAVGSVMSVARKEPESISAFCTAEFPTCGAALQLLQPLCLSNRVYQSANIHLFFSGFESRSVTTGEL